MDGRCIEFPLDSGDGAQSHDSVGRFRLSKNESGDCRQWRTTCRNGPSQFLLKKDARGRMFFWGNQSCGKDNDRKR